jgi:hypothetical protein
MVKKILHHSTKTLFANKIGGDYLHVNFKYDRRNGNFLPYFTIFTYLKKK